MRHDGENEGENIMPWSGAHLTRRQSLVLGSRSVVAGLLAGSLALERPLAAADAARDLPVKTFARYADLLDTLRRQGRTWRTLGHTLDGSPIVAVKCGGEKKPAILVSAGAHSTEHAGVVAAVEVIEQLQTKHEVWVLPTRDPIGLGGFRHALSLGLGQPPAFSSLDDAEALLRSEGEILLDEGGRLIVLIGDYGYANRGLYGSVKKGEAFLEPLKGRRLWFPSRAENQPGAGPLERAYTLIVTPDGEVLHINRFHDTRWAPIEVRCVRRLMAQIRPGLTFDLHEYGGNALWMSARRQKTDEDELWERRMGTEAMAAVKADGASLAPDDYSPGVFFEKLERGLYWLDPGKRGEGYNLVDYAAKEYGPGFTIETGMEAPLADRVRRHLILVQTAVNVFEERFA
jgi:hypothetical protein